MDYDLEALRELVRAALEAGRCPYCGDALTVHNFSLDHDRPRSRGGRHSLPNLVCYCRRCNEVKGQLTGEEFRALIRLLRAGNRLLRAASFPVYARAGKPRFEVGACRPYPSPRLSGTFGTFMIRDVRPPS